MIPTHFVLPLFMAAASGQQPPRTTKAEQDIRALEAVRLQFPNKTSMWSGHVADDAVFQQGTGVIVNRGEFLDDADKNAYEDSQEMSDTKFSAFGDVAVFSYVFARIRHDDARSVRHQHLRRTVVYQHVAAGWQMISSCAAEIPWADLQSRPVDPAILDGYVGLWTDTPEPNTVTLTRDGTDLMAQGSNEKDKTHLLALSDDTFVVRGDAALITFKKGSDGKVNESTWRDIGGSVETQRRMDAPSSPPLPAGGAASTLGDDHQLSGGPQTLLVQSGSFTLRALVWRPPGRGPFPGILFNHGSGHATGTDAAGRHDQRHPEILGPVFAKHGYVFLYLFRRGDGLSAGQGTPSADLMEAELAAKGQDARNKLQVQLLETEVTDDLAALQVLRALPEVDKTRIAVVGHSFGASLTLLVAERDQTLRAAVVFSSAGYSWDRSPRLRQRLLGAVHQIETPVLFIHAENDYSLGSGRVLDAEMARLGHAHRLMIYPPVGQTVDEGHNFIHLKVATWEPDVFAFLDEHLRR